MFWMQGAPRAEGLSLRVAASAKSVKVLIKVILGFFIEDSTKDEFTSI